VRHGDGRRNGNAAQLTAVAIVIADEQSAIVIQLGSGCNARVRFETARTGTIAAYGRPARLQGQECHQQYEKQAAHGDRLYQEILELAPQVPAAPSNSDST
jgi:cysteine sulfinate desulfinase/cysteine desulfurase-like protein